MNEKSFGINVDIEDLTYPLAIEKEIRLRSRLAMLSGKTELRMVFVIEVKKDGRCGGASVVVDVPQGALLPDGDPVYRKTLEGFCNSWERERKDKRTEWINFKIMLMDFDSVNQFKDVFTIKAKEE